MAVESEMVEVGAAAPSFDLPTVDGGRVALDQIDEPVVAVMFLCNHCPYVQHVEDELGRLAADDELADVAFVGICSNDPDAYPEDAPEGLRAQAERAGWTFPYAVDADSSVGRAYRAACTPDFFVYGRDRTLVYRGAFDRSSPGNDRPVDGSLLRGALRAAVAGDPVPEPHTPAMGCSIKWADG
jgi:peroxiredoxin